jgi:hypothetical protein
MCRTHLDTGTVILIYPKAFFVPFISGIETVALIRVAKSAPNSALGWSDHLGKCDETTLLVSHSGRR